MNTRENVDAVKAGDAASGIESLYSGTASTAKIDTRENIASVHTTADNKVSEANAGTALAGMNTRENLNALNEGDRIS